MRTLRLSRLALVLFLATSFWLGAAFVAHAQFTRSATGGPLTVSTASSFGPDAPTGRIWLCLPGVSVTTIVSWDAGGASGSVQVLRGSSPSGPFTPVATRLPLVGWVFDTMHLFSTSVYYEITVGGGAPSAPVRVDLPSPTCRF
jgi:hypothetical protein